MTGGAVPAAERFRELARDRPDKPALIVDGGPAAPDTVVSREALDAASADLAARLAASAAATPRPPVVVIDAANDARTVIAFAACMRARLPFLPLDPLMPEAEAARVLDALSAHRSPVAVEDTASPAGRPHAATGRGGYLLATGGSSGTPRLIEHPRPLDHDPARVPNAMLRAVGWRSGQRQLIAGPLHHAAPFMCCWEGLLGGDTLVVLPRFDPRRMLRAIDEHAIEWAQLTPVHLQWGLAALERSAYSLRSLNAVMHTAAPCPAEVKRAWIDLLGPTRLYEVYGATEAVGTTLLRGDEWLERPGSVGRGFCTQIRIVDEDGRLVPPGVEGEVLMRRTTGRDAVGRELGGASGGVRWTVDGFAGVGDVGRLDASGHLYLAARRHDMVIVGGGNVYPAEVEAALAEHPDILDVAAVGRADGQLGGGLLALVIKRPGSALTEAAVADFARGRLAPHKVPWTVRFVTELPRTEAGKLHRRRLAEQEVTGV
ncbi:AMP-binding protein [Actinomadura verrucosospora]|uniref:AMP-dependent synthetase and ligase n=1 Tax=Actinomadura verrucosospora TaxID=46165 RepID=A0A7D3W1D8_ACTVE|nr:AMP-binding protein [Actinomadura verrucosospora]QKG27199.1 AMP-dependent synthetase and ligase [Actinomadura verrucosospora]